MKKKDIVGLIKAYSEKDDVQFRNFAYTIARDFQIEGDPELGKYIIGLLSNTNVLVPQDGSEQGSFLSKAFLTKDPLFLPKPIEQDVFGIVNAIKRNSGVNKFLFEGRPGSGKTETVKQLARLLGKDLYVVNFNSLIDSRLGQSAKNISGLFKEIRDFPQKNQVLILFDEIDALAMERVDSSDLREMGRVTTSLFKEMDSLDPSVLLVATTNLFDKFDKAFLRRFDYVISFDRYSRSDLIDISEEILNSFLSRYHHVGRNMPLFKKILQNMKDIPYPGIMKNLIKTSLAFSDPDSEFDYMRRFYGSVNPDSGSMTIETLQKEGYSLREIGILLNMSKSQAGREIKKL